MLLHGSLPERHASTRNAVAQPAFSPTTVACGGGSLLPGAGCNPQPAAGSCVRARWPFMHNVSAIRALAQRRPCRHTQCATPSVGHVDCLGALINMRLYIRLRLLAARHACLSVQPMPRRPHRRTDACVAATTSPACHGRSKRYRLPIRILWLTTRICFFLVLLHFLARCAGPREHDRVLGHVRPG